MRENTANKKKERRTARPQRRVQYASVPIYPVEELDPLRDAAAAFAAGLTKARARSVQEAVAKVINGAQDASDDLDIREA